MSKQYAILFIKKYPNHGICGTKVQRVHFMGTQIKVPFVALPYKVEIHREFPFSFYLYFFGVINFYRYVSHVYSFACQLPLPLPGAQEFRHNLKDSLTHFSV